MASDTSEVSSPFRERRSASCSETLNVRRLRICGSSPAVLENMIDEFDRFRIDDSSATSTSSLVSTQSDMYIDNSDCGDDFTVDKDDTILQRQTGHDLQDQAAPDPTSDISQQTYENPYVILKDSAFGKHENAQHLYTPDACIFVANLPKAMPDSAIRAELYQAFVQFGTLWIKIRRDPCNLPVAFERSFAETALQYGRDVRVGGRRVRLEQAKCDRVIFCSVRSPGMDENGNILNDIPPSDYMEIEKLVSKYGELDGMVPVALRDQMLYDIPPGIWIMFKMYGACQDAVKALYSHKIWRFDLFRVKDATRRTRLGNDGRIPSDDHRAIRRLKPNVDFVITPDCGSVVAAQGLPWFSSDLQLIRLFCQFGSVISIEHRASPPNFRRVFVSFREPDAGPNLQAGSIDNWFCVDQDNQYTSFRMQVKTVYINPVVPHSTMRFTSKSQQPPFNNNKSRGKGDMQPLLRFLRGQAPPYDVDGTLHTQSVQTTHDSGASSINQQSDYKVEPAQDDPAVMQWANRGRRGAISE